MMKKTGFTLAEVLITLSIIGIVAMMTLPALMTNVQEQQAKTGLKKGLNTVIEAAQMHKAVEGFDYGDISEGGYGENSQTVSGILLNRTQIDPSKSNLPAPDATIFDALGDATTEANLVATGTSDGTATNAVVFFRDGSALVYGDDATGGNDANARALEADNLPHGFVVVYDINGAKAPNLLSNCNSDLTLRAQDGLGTDPATGETVTGPTPDSGDLNNACTKANRVIKDQFMIRLRGSFAQPEGAAAWWAFNH